MESLDVLGVPGASPLKASLGVTKVESGSERVCKKAKSCAPGFGLPPATTPTTKPPAVTARKSQPAKPEQPQQPASPAPTLSYSPKPSMPPPPSLLLKAEPQLRRMPPRPSSYVATPIAGALVKQGSGTEQDQNVKPSYKAEISPSVAPTNRAVITPSRATASQHLKVQPAEVPEASTVPADTQVDDTQVDSQTTTMQPTPPVEPTVPTVVQPTPNVAAQPKQAPTPQPKQIPTPQPKHTPQPKQAPNAVQSPVHQQQTDLDKQFQVQNNDGNGIEHSNQKERQQHYAAFKRQVTGEITSITVPHEFSEAWKTAVASKSRSAKNKLFQLWCSAGGSWSKIFGLT